MQHKAEDTATNTTRSSTHTEQSTTYPDLVINYKPESG